MDSSNTATGTPVLKKTCFSAWATMLNVCLINKGGYGMFVACGIGCLADILSVSPLLEQTEGLWGNPTQSLRLLRRRATCNARNVN